MSQKPHYDWVGKDCEDVANDLRHGRHYGEPKDLSVWALFACYLTLIWASVCIIYQTAQSLAWVWQLVTGGAR